MSSLGFDFAAVAADKVDFERDSGGYTCLERRDVIERDRPAAGVAGVAATDRFTVGGRTGFASVGIGSIS